METNNYFFAQNWSKAHDDTNTQRKYVLLVQISFVAKLMHQWIKQQFGSITIIAVDKRENIIKNLTLTVGGDIRIDANFLFVRVDCWVCFCFRLPFSSPFLFIWTTHNDSWALNASLCIFINSFVSFPFAYFSLRPFATLLMPFFFFSLALVEKGGAKRNAKATKNTFI